MGVCTCGLLLCCQPLCCGWSVACRCRSRPAALLAVVTQAGRERLLAPDGRLSEEEAERIRGILLALPATGGGTTGVIPITAASSIEE